MSSIRKLLFVDTNLWLDFYRARNDAGLALLSHLESVADCIIATYQLEMEFKKHRQEALLEGFQVLKAPSFPGRPGLFSDAKAMKSIQKSADRIDKQFKGLKSRLSSVLKDPTRHDRVYQVCQRVFHREDPLVLTRDNPIRHVIRRRAFRRFLLGCPPRKRQDTSIGDALNWEWMIHCAVEGKAELVIASRDSDYGVTHDGSSYINDHLRQEFSERVSRKRNVLLYSRLSDALKHFKVPVTKQEVAEESQLVQESLGRRIQKLNEEQIQHIMKLFSSPEAPRDEDATPPAPAPRV